MKNPKMHIAVALLAAFLSCAGIPAASPNSVCMTVSAEAVTEFTENTALDADVTVEGDAVISADLNLNGHTLTVSGNLFQTAGTLTVSEGSTLNITGDYWHKAGILSIADASVQLGGNYELHVDAGQAGSGEFKIDGNAVFEISGNMVIDTVIGRSYYQKSGTIKVGGDLLVYNPNGGQGLEPSDAVTMHFTGKKQHKVYFDSTGCNYLTNVSTDSGSSLLLEGCTSGFNMLSDISLVDGSRIVGSRNLTLNGHKLHVGGDFYQSGSMTIFVDKGWLTVAGTYWHQQGILSVDDGIVRIDGSYELHTDNGTAGSGEFRLTGEGKTIFRVGGNMVIDTVNGRSYYQKAGLIKIGGDLKVYNPNGGQGLEPGSDVTVHFFGKKQHEIYFDSAGLNHLTNVSADAESTLLLSGQASGFTFLSDLTFAGGSSIHGSTALNLNTHSLTVSGDFIHSGAQPVYVGSSTLRVHGNYLHQHGILSVENGNIAIDGSYELHVMDGTAGDGELRITGTGDSVFSVGGDMVIDTVIGRSYYQSAGTVKISGDFRCYAPNGGEGYEPGSELKTVFTGEKLHEVYFASDALSHLSSVSVEDGGTLYLSGNNSGFTLDSDVIFADGSAISGSRPLYLKGHTLTAAGTFYQNGPNVYIEGGKMLVAQDYWQQHGILDISDGTVNIGNRYELHVADGNAGDGELKLGSETARLIVGGDAVIDTVIGRSYYQKAGRICIGGNLSVYAPNGGVGFENGSELELEFRGGGAHEFYLANTGDHTGKLRLGIGDTLKFTGTLNGVDTGAEAAISVEDAALAAVSDLSLTGQTAGEGTVTFQNGSSKAEKVFSVGASDTEQPYLGVTVDPKTERNLRGDINGDGTFSISDAVLLTRWLSGDENCTVAVWKNGDFNGDGALTAVDLSMMKRELSGQYAAAAVIASNINTDDVSGHPTAKSTFTVEKECRVFSILTDHRNDGKGAAAGSIGLLEDGVSVGTWAASGVKGQTGAADCWLVCPHDLVLKPGHTYTVLDSESETWSQNSASGGASFFEIRGTVTE